MQRAYAGSTFTATFTVTTGGTFSSRVVDGLNREAESSVSESGGTATLTVASGAWHDGRSGFGRIEIIRTSGGVKTVEVSERFRILPGLEAEADALADYWW